jgi:SulP family sulfate permease
MGEWHEVPKMMRHTWTDRSVWLTSFALTVFTDLTVAVQVGMTLAALLYVRRVSSTTTISRVTPESVERDRSHVLQDKQIPADVAMLRVHGPFLFGATAKLHAITDQLPLLPPTIIIRLRNMTAIDATALHAFEELAEQVRDSGRTLIFCGARQQPRAVMEQTGFVDVVGHENVCADVERALARAGEIARATAVA